MNANVVELPVLQENFAGPSKCAEEITQINESLAAPRRPAGGLGQGQPPVAGGADVRAVVPDVLRLIGESAGVDRVNLMLSQAGPGGEPLLVVASEWVAEGVVPHLEDPATLLLRRARFLGGLQ